MTQFYSPLCSAVHRTAAQFGGAAPPSFWHLPCNASARYLGSVVADAVARRSLGREAMHVFPQVIKLDTAHRPPHRLHRIGLQPP